MFAYFCGVNTTAMADFKLPTQRHWSDLEKDGHSRLLWTDSRQLWHIPELGGNRQCTIWVSAIIMAPLRIYCPWKQLCGKKLDFSVRYIQVIKAFIIYYCVFMGTQWSYLWFWICFPICTMRIKRVSPLHCSFKNIIMYVTTWHNA